ncbi:MAG TPA: hypothetical protein VE986_01435 [Hyphomicrobiales bacterium]|nr:hypothetical protein [Hyphomicrobiales bacterium]
MTADTLKEIAAAAAMNGFDEPIRFSNLDRLKDGVSFVASHPRLSSLWFTVTRAPDDWATQWRVRSWAIVHSPIDFQKDGEETIWDMPRLGWTEHGGNSGKTIGEAIEFAKQVARDELDRRYKLFLDEWFQTNRLPLSQGSSEKPNLELLNLKAELYHIVQRLMHQGSQASEAEKMAMLAQFGTFIGIGAALWFEGNPDAIADRLAEASRFASKTAAYYAQLINSSRRAA